MVLVNSFKRIALFLTFIGSLLVSYYIAANYRDFARSAPTLSADVAAPILGNYSIESFSGETVLMDAPRLLNLSLYEIEAVTGKPIVIQFSEDIEKRLYHVKFGKNLEETAEVSFGYRDGIPRYCTLKLPFHETSDYESFNLIGIDNRFSFAPEVQRLRSRQVRFWRKGIFENRLYELSLTYRYVEDVSAGGYVAEVKIEVREKN